MKSYVDQFLDLPAKRRHEIMARLTQAERRALWEQLEYREKHPWMKYEGDPVRFVEEGLGEALWGKQKEILRSIVENERTVVPATHAPGKTHLAARAVAYFMSVYPPGTAKVITTASSFKQVRNIMWPHVRRLHHVHQLQGYVNQTEWMLGEPEQAYAQGIKPPDDDEAGMQGHHAPNMLVVVDEAGGISPGFGRNLEALMTGGNSRLLVLGNPPVDEEGTWFERISQSPQYNCIPISAFDTPNFTGEHTDMCHSCPPGVVPHNVSTHLVDDDWVQSVRNEFGEDSAYYQARVLARFPRSSTSKTLPMAWLEAARDNDETERGRICLGVDIASDGGDEFAIAQLDGWNLKIVHHRSGADNEDATRVAGQILEHIRTAENLHIERGISQPVRVKIDAIGVGWGIVGILKQWHSEGKFKAEIIGVNVAEKARDSEKFTNQRAEMWWNFRQLIQPNENDDQVLHLGGLEQKELAQLNAPTYRTDSSGRIQIEGKPEMKKRGVGSPDRAEAMLLAAFEPPSKEKTFTPVVSLQTNVWSSAFGNLA